MSDIGLGRPRALNRQDLGVGLIFIAFGLLFGIDTLVELPIGTARRMGPGFFPLVLSGILIVVGIAVALRGIGTPEQPSRPVPWRAAGLILAAPVVFGATVRGLGLVPSIVVMVLITSFAARHMTILRSLLMAAGLAVFCVLVFNVGLGLPIRLMGTWWDPLLRPSG